MPQNENIHISELLAVAREAQGSNYVKGDKILCQKRFQRETAHMIEFIVKGEGTALGRMGEYNRLFLTQGAYKKALIWEKQQKISIQKYARVKGHTLIYLPVPREISP